MSAKRTPTWRISDWQESRGMVDLAVSDGTHVIRFERCMFGANRENALAWAVEQIEALRTHGNFGITCEHCPEQGKPLMTEVSDGADR